MRQMERGSACSTRQTSDIINIGVQLGIPISKIKNMTKRNELCEIILNQILTKHLEDHDKTYFLFWGPPL